MYITYPNVFQPRGDVPRIPPFFLGIFGTYSIHAKRKKVRKTDRRFS